MKKTIKAWVILDDLNRPHWFQVYPTRRDALNDKAAWEFTGCRPCRVEIVLPKKLPPQP